MRKAGWVVAVLLVVAAGAAFWAYESLDVIVKYALEHYGPQVTGVSFEVGEVRLSPSDGRGSVRRVDIGNPPGFTAPRAARLGEISVWVDPATVRSPVVVIHELVVDAPLITYERSDRGTNLDAIQNFEGDDIDPDALRAKGLVHKHGLVKVLGRGEVTRAVRVKAHAFSKSAEQAITAAGGSVEVLPPPFGHGRPAAKGNALTNR